jgi:putative endonuclease
MKGYMYVLECLDGSYYVGSTNDLDLRFQQHQNGEGANHTRKRLPVELVYYEVFDRIDFAFNREKQVQGWSRKKKEALINAKQHELPLLSKNYTQFPRKPVFQAVPPSTSTSSVTEGTD